MPSADAVAHSRAVVAFIAERLDSAGGWLSFSEYMRHALYAPGLGYYSAGAAKFGAEGDFVTAPLISPLFARTCARRIARWLKAIDGGALLEFGPGTGRFARDALEVLGTADSPLRRYQLLEVSADLRQRQQQLLQPFAARFELEWCSALPANFRGVVFANEVLDALPAERFVVRAGQWWRLGVGRGASGDFEWRIRPADGACSDDELFEAEARRRRDALWATGISLPEGYCGEWQRGLAPWFTALAEALEHAVVLIADYGLPRLQLLHPDRMQGSLRCHYRHHALSDPFSYPGLADITTWVDFTSVAEAATDAGFGIAGFTTQAAFLMGAGIDQEFAAAGVGLEPATPGYLELARGLRTLVLPGEMGEAVKFMVLTRNVPPDFFGDDSALTLQDLRASL